jgi:hypothetical protein
MTGEAETSLVRSQWSNVDDGLETGFAAPNDRRHQRDSWLVEDAMQEDGELTQVR